MEYPADEAVDCMQLFSRIETSPGSGRSNSHRSFLRLRAPRPGKTAWKRRNVVYEMMQAVMATLRPQPALSPTYRLENAITQPMTVPISTARMVSWGTSSPA